ncbi:MAG: TonB-dependent receptor [Acidobacteriaceae bacterium]|nr:TonB-dependent receptor [Acidobacteriaceae bacterium]
MSKHFFLLLVFAIVRSSSLYSAEPEAAITGKVLDPQGRTVAGAVVSLFAKNGTTQLTTTASSGGNYSLNGLKSGDYLLQAGATGFSSYRSENVHLDSGQQLKLDVTLSIGTVQQEVSVTAASTPQAVDQVSKALTIVDSSSIEERQDYSLADAVRLTPALRIDQEGGPGAFTEIQIRGLRPEDTAVLVDGMRLRDPSGTQADASSLLEDFLLPDINRIEILRGSGSSLYGTDAIGGVVNVITGQGGGATHGSIQLEGGSLGLFRGSALVAGGTKNDRIQYSAGLMHLNVVNGVDDDDPARISSAQGRISVRLAPGVQLVARLLAADSFIKLNTSPQALADFPSGILPAIPLRGAALAQFNAGVPISSIDSGNATYIPSLDDSDSTRGAHYETGALTLLGQASPVLGYVVDYQIVDSTRRYGNGPAGPPPQPSGNTRTDYNGRVETVNARVNYQPGSYSLITAGYEFENESFNTVSTASFAPTSNSFIGAAQRSHTAFAQDQVRLFGDRLYLSAAFRAQFFSLEQPSFLPTASAPYSGIRFSAPPAAYTGDGSFAYFLRHSQTKIRAHVGRGYRAPSLYERFGAGYDSFFGYSVYGDPTLKPEQSIAVDAGLDQSLFSNKLRLSATYFYTHLQRVIMFDFSGLINPLTDPFGRSFGYLNTSGGFSRGVEFNAEWAVNKSLTVSGAYAYTDARERTPLVPGVYRSFFVPEHEFSAFAVERVGRRTFVDFALNGSDSYRAQLYSTFSSGAYSFAGIKRADLGVGYRLPLSERKAIRFFGKGENIFDQQYYEGGFVTAGITGRGGLEFEF